MAYHLNMRVPLKERLAARKRSEGEDWRKAPDCVNGVSDSYNPRMDHAFHGERHVRWVEHADKVLRFVGYADDVAKSEGSRCVENRGWFFDNWQNEVFRGVVYQLPARKGVPFYVYGYADPWNRGSALLSFDGEDNALQAAVNADRFAEVCAEEEREYQAKESAKARIAEIGAEVATVRGEIIALVKEAREKCEHMANAERIKGAIRARVEQLLAVREALFRERERLQEDPFSPYYR